MRRICTKSEQNLLCSNKEQVLDVNNTTKDFFEQDNLMINAATIVEVDANANRFAYIEDGFKDESGKSIIVDAPSCPKGMTSKDVGKRILVVSDSESGFQLVKLNEQLKELISDEGSDSPQQEELSECMRVPHPNIARIEREGHELSESERVEFAELHLKARRGATAKIFKICVVALAIILAILCALLNIVEGGYPLSQTVPIAVVGYVGLMLFCLIMFRIGNVNIKKQGQFTHMKKVVFRCFAPEENVFTVFVYEWIDGKLQICEYPDERDLLTHAVCGDILYKFTDQKGNIILQRIRLESR